MRIAHSARGARALGIGVVHQECLVFDNLTVGREPVRQCAPAAARRSSTGATLRARRGTMLRDSWVPTSTPTCRPAALSIAQKHVVQIARALVNESRVLILDEPTASLSQRECAELFRIARQLRDAGCALLFISHKFDEIFELADRYAVFRDGVSVGEGELAATSPRRADPPDGRPAGRAVVSEAGRRSIGEPSCCASRSWAAPANSKTSAFSLRRGEILGIYGLVGAGRTELAQVLFGTQRRRIAASRRVAPRTSRWCRKTGSPRAAFCRFRSRPTSRSPNLATLAPRGWCSRRRENRAGASVDRRASASRRRDPSSRCRICPAAISRKS